MNEIRFIRVNGRVIPIKKKKADGVAKIVAAKTVSVTAGLYAAKQIRKANFSYSRSANLRGASKLVAGKGKVYSDLIRNSAAFKISGKKFARKGFGALAIGATIATALANDGARSLTKDEKKVAAATTAVTAAGIFAFSRKSRIGGLVKLARKINPKSPVSGIASLYKTQGMRRTAATIKKYSKTVYKGNTKPKNIFNAQQMDLINTPKFDIVKWLKGKK